MATITVRNLPDAVQRALKHRAVANDRSMEAEVRAILEDAVAAGGAVERWLATTQAVREEHGGIELDLPAREPARPLDLA